ncbi:MAG: hypothetical protein CMC15_15985 [Flavobacteriaceae bacterium]|jgi:hypothetical protein|nr:hypothetical protein [Flavobacteriaceae bacterium]|tara:strand:- start:3626 stop:3844 length:219 start_codon:yes stop_codon:yes gene_type:complete
MSGNLDPEEFAAFVRQQKEWRNFYKEKKGYDVFEWLFDIFKTIMTIPILIIMGISSIFLFTFLLEILTQIVS